MSVIISEEQVAQEFLELKQIRLDKILNDREKLMDRMSSRHEPFPDGAFEKLSRNNIWETVLEYLDPSTLASAYSCCSTFQFHSEESLLIHVFNVLKNKAWLYLQHVQCDGPLNESRWFNAHNIWALQLVSKSWKRVMEQVHMNEVSDPSWYANYPCVFPIWTHRVFVNQYEGIARATNILEGSDSRAMLCQLFYLGTGTSGYDIGWLERTLAFLKKHGALIRGAYIHGCPAVSTPVTRYKILRNFMTWSPNLKWLIVNNDYISPNDIDTDKDELNDLIKASPLPTIQSLTSIEFVSEYENEVILNEVMRANTQVKCLRLPRKTPVTEPVQLQMRRLTGLEEYRIRAGSEESVTQLTTVLRDTKWPLKHLKIGFVYGMIVGTIEELFDLVNRFAPTLETLGWVVHPSKVELHHRLELPKLKNISFDYYAWHPAVGLDFLLPCRSLEQIHFVDLLTVDDGGSDTGRVLIGYKNTVEESNIWKWFSRLVCVRFEEHVAFVEEERKGTPQHYVRKGSGVVKVPSAWNCKIKCKKYVYI